MRTCFDHVLSKLSGFSWERILFLKSACVNMVMQIQVQIGDTRRVFFMKLPGSIEDLKKLHFAWDSEDTFYGFWFTLRKRWIRICSVAWLVYLPCLRLTRIGKCLVKATKLSQSHLNIHASCSMCSIQSGVIFLWTNQILRRLTGSPLPQNNYYSLLKSFSVCRRQKSTQIKKKFMSLYLQLQFLIL